MIKEDYHTEEKFDNILPQQVYQELILAIQQVPDLKISTAKMASLAWLVERIKQEDPQNWSVKIQEMKSIIETLSKKGGKFEVSHFLLREIDDRYAAFLNVQLQQETDERIRKNLESMLRMIENDKQFAQKVKEKNEPVGFGGVSLDFVPKWFYTLKEENNQKKM